MAWHPERDRDFFPFSGSAGRQSRHPDETRIRDFPLHPDLLQSEHRNRSVLCRLRCACQVFPYDLTVCAANLFDSGLFAYSCPGHVTPGKIRFEVVGVNAIGGCVTSWSYGMMCIFCVRIFKAGIFPLNSVSRSSKNRPKARFDDRQRGIRLCLMTRNSEKRFPRYRIWVQK